MSHYSIAHDTPKLYDWSLRIAQTIHDEVAPRKNTIALIYSGMSGISLATAIQMAYMANFGTSLQMIYVRKPNENSHGSKVEFEDVPFLDEETKKDHDLIFVDDFISSGETFARCLDGYIDYYRPYIMSKISSSPSHSPYEGEVPVAQIFSVNQHEHHVHAKSAASSFGIIIKDALSKFKLTDPI